MIDSYTRLTPLHIASINGRTDIVNYIMSNVLDINPKDRNGDTPLHYATLGNKSNMNGNRLEIIQYVMEKLEENNPMDKYGKTPIDLAHEGKHWEIVKVASKYWV